MTMAQPGAEGSPSAGRAASPDELRLVEALRRGDEAAFVSVVRRYHAALVRSALPYVPSRAVAEEVAQETWMAVLRGLDRFHGRASLKTWIFRILLNRARTRGESEGRCVPFSALGSPEAELAVDPDRFLPRDHPRWPGHWASPLRSWSGTPEEHLLSEETIAYVQGTAEALPPSQRAVITLRDIHGCTPAEVRDMLGISDANQRVLLHRARSRVRRALEQYLEAE